MVDAPTGAKDEIARIWRAYLSLSVILTARICKPAVARFVHSMGGIGTSMWVLFASFTFLLKRSTSAKARPFFTEGMHSLSLTELYRFRPWNEMIYNRTISSPL